MDYLNAPTWLKAADSHNVAAHGESWFDNLDPDEIAQSLENIPKATAVSLISGLNSFYNTGIAVANLALPKESEIPYADTAEVIASFDDDTARYYKSDREFFDAVGFGITALLPGIGGIKVLKAGQEALRAASAGNIGSNLARATGLLAPKMENYVVKHAAELATKNTVWKLSQLNTLKTIGVGFQQSMLEGLAFEGAVLATMGASPIFSEESVSDIIKNAAKSSLFFGGLGALGGLATSYFGVSKLTKLIDARQVKFATDRTFVEAHATAESDYIIAAASDLKRLETPVSYEEVLAEKVAKGETGYGITEEAINAEVVHLNRLRETNIRSLHNFIRENIGKLHRSSKKDSPDSFSNLVADVFKNSSADATYNLFDRLSGFTRLAEKSDYAKAVSTAVRTSKVSKEEAMAILGEDTTTYIQLHSGGILDVFEELPETAKRLADRYTPTELLKHVENNAIAKINTTDFSKLKKASDAEARWIKYRNSTKPLSAKKAYYATDLPAINKAIADNNTNINIIMPNGEIVRFDTVRELETLYRKAQEGLAQSLFKRKVSIDDIELITNIRKDALLGKSRWEPTDPKNFMAQETYAAELTRKLGRSESEAITVSQLYTMPKYLKANHLPDMVVDGNTLKGLQAIEYSNIINKEATDRVVVAVLGDEANYFVDYSDDAIRAAHRGGTGQGITHFAGGALGSTERTTAYNANLVAKIEQKRVEALKLASEAEINGLLGDSRAAIAWSGLNELRANQSEMFVLAKEGDRLIPKKVADHEAKMAEFAANGEYDKITEFDPSRLAEGTALSIDIPENIRGIAELHVEFTAKRNGEFSKLHSAQGNLSQQDPRAFYPVRQDPRQYKHHAFVKDSSVSGVGHTKMILARSGEELEALVAKVPADSNLRVYTSVDTDEYYKAIDTWMYDRTLHDNYLDIELPAKGIRASYMPMTDPDQIATTFLQYHIRGENAVIREAVATKFNKFISQMEARGRIYSGIQGSSTDAISKLAVSTKNNPYMAQVKGLFNISRIEDAPDWWINMQTALDRGVSTAYNKVDRIAHQAFNSGKLATLAEDANKVFQEMGIKTAYNDAALQLLVNSRVDRGVLTKFVRGANAFLNDTVLRSDTFNAINNTVGNTILMSTELMNLVKDIRAASPELAGKLAELAELAVPGTAGQKIFSAKKLIANAQRQVAELYPHWKAGTLQSTVYGEFDRRALLPSLGDQLFRSIDAVTLTGATTARDIHKATTKVQDTWGRWMKFASKASGNELAEQNNRLITGLAVKSITDLAVQAGKITEKEAWPYIHTVIARVNGAVRASERPLMFQGPIGQAIGLFQTYQLTLMQQAFRYLGEGRSKTIALLAGLQTTIYGANSLPGFNLINHHLIGMASGNESHNDIYSATYKAFGKEGAEWLMYGVPSNLLNSALYTRGDTNPRVWTVVPNPMHPEEIPLISAFSTAIGSVMQAAESVTDGAPVWGAFLSAIEHSGLSRPLAGLATVARGHSTQRSGNFLYENDLLSLSSLARVAGAKPIDEAIMQNSYYREQAYASADRAKRNEIGVAIRESISSGGEITQDMVNDFAEKYVEYGGSQKQFNSYFMRQYKNATVSQAEQLRDRLSNPYAQRLQLFMGGSDYLDD